MRRGGIVLGVPLVLYKWARNNSSYLYYVVKGPSVNCTCVPAWEPWIFQVKHNPNSKHKVEFKTAPNKPYITRKQEQEIQVTLQFISKLHAYHLLLQTLVGFISWATQRFGEIGDHIQGIQKRTTKPQRDLCIYFRNNDPSAPELNCNYMLLHSYLSCCHFIFFFFKLIS